MLLKRSILNVTKSEKENLREPKTNKVKNKDNTNNYRYLSKKAKKNTTAVLEKLFKSIMI